MLRPLVDSSPLVAREGGHEEALSLQLARKNSTFTICVCARLVTVHQLFLRDTIVIILHHQSASCRPSCVTGTNHHSSVYNKTQPLPGTHPVPQQRAWALQRFACGFLVYDVIYTHDWHTYHRELVTVSARRAFACRVEGS
ncbi:hypothetical protein E2C01_029424 [Portunus trituberculatus]|uniref:Uncharacterized protein n=1 Tax=Portunus trituberculatus TaxID=210409 RepID=A0A5B7ESV9_PORTR|nr:hypothetical protein [Portunus trituberculatus]